jgi:hypothetical protein
VYTSVVETFFRNFLSQSIFFRIPKATASSKLNQPILLAPSWKSRNWGKSVEAFSLDKQDYKTLLNQPILFAPSWKSRNWGKSVEAFSLGKQNYKTLLSHALAALRNGHGIRLWNRRPGFESRHGIRF